MNRLRETRLRCTLTIATAAAWLALSSGGCERRSEVSNRGGDEPVVLETVEVDGPPDSTLSTTTDEKARAIGDPGVSGALPGGFPQGVPLYQPSTVIDFGDTGSERYVVFRASDSPNVVRVGLLAEWEQAGWRSAGGEAYRRGAETIGLTLSGSDGSTEIRISY